MALVTDLSEVDKKTIAKALICMIHDCRETLKWSYDDSDKDSIDEVNLDLERAETMYMLIAGHKAPSP